MTERDLIAAYLAFIQDKKHPPSGEYGYLKPGGGVGTKVGEKLRRRKKWVPRTPVPRETNFH